jgi:hypothetical protein
MSDGISLLAAAASDRVTVSTGSAVRAICRPVQGPEAQQPPEPHWASDENMRHGPSWPVTDGQ